MRSLGALERHRPQPLHELAVASSVCDSLHSRIGKNVELGFGDDSMSVAVVAMDELAAAVLVPSLPPTGTDTIESAADFDFRGSLSVPFLSSFFRSRTRVP